MSGTNRGEDQKLESGFPSDESSDFACQRFGGICGRARRGGGRLPFDAPSPSGRQPLILALGKDALAYLLDRNNLGGIGGSLTSETVSTGPIRTAPAAYPVADSVFIAFQAQSAHCPSARSDNNLTVLQIRAGSPPSLATTWCGAFKGGGSPIVTTTDGRANPIVPGGLRVDQLDLKRVRDPARDLVLQDKQIVPVVIEPLGPQMSIGFGCHPTGG